MFFDRPGTPSESTVKPLTTKRRRQIAALGLAATMAVPFGAMKWARALGDTPPAQDAAAPAAADLLKTARQQMQAGNYDQAVETLKQIDTSTLSDIDRRLVVSALANATAGADEAHTARNELAAGRSALNANRLIEAREHFNAVLTNPYAQPDTKAAANDELSRAGGPNTGSTASANGLRVQLADDVQGVPPAPPTPGNSAVPAIESTPNPTTAPAATPSPAPAAAPAPAPVSPTTAPSADAGPTTAPAEVPAVAAAPTPTGAEYYHLAQQQFRKGDWIAARSNFEAAKAAGYKPGLFEGESPAEYLARMDAKEAADKAATEAAIEKANLLAQAHARQVVAEPPPPAPVTPPPAQLTAVPAPAPTTAPVADNTPPASATPVPSVPAAPAPQPAAPTPPPAPVAATPTAAPTPVPTPVPAPVPVPPAPAPDTTASTPTTAPAATPVVSTETPTTAPTPSVPAVPLVPATPVADQSALSDLQTYEKVRLLKLQQDEYEASRLAGQGSDAMHAVPPDLAAAEKYYQQAATLDPNNPQAKAGLKEVLILEGKPVPAEGFTSQEQHNKAAREEITYQVDSALTEAHTDTAKNDFPGADTAIIKAGVASRTDPTIFTADELRHFDDEIAAAKQANDAAKAQYLQNQAIVSNHAVSEKIKNDEAAAKRQRDGTIASLRTQVIDLSNHKRYKEALAVVDQILTLDPNDDFATGIRPLLEDKYNFEQQRIYTERKDYEIANSLNRAEEEKIPYEDILVYPTDWPSISQTRDQTVEAERGENKEDRAVQAQLDRALPELSFDGVGFSDVIDFLRDVSGANIFVNKKSLEAAGVDLNAPVSAKLRNVKFSKALSIILDSVGGGTAKLGYTIDQGVIEIATADELGKNTITRVYDIRDLIIDIPDFDNAPQFDLQSASNQGSQGGSGGSSGGGGSGSGLFGNSGSQNSEDKSGKTRQELVDSITKLITETVAPDSWRDSGGSIGAIRELQGQLIVTQTPENQRQLVSLLEQLREEHSIQVTIETRFLTVTRNFLEDIGVDLSFIFNANNVNSNVFSSIPVTATNSSFTQSPTTNVPGSIGSTATGLTTAVTYLDNLQVNLMLRATEASELNTEVTAPRVTLFNGQRGYVLVSTQQAYVSDLTPSVGTGGAAFAPQIGIVNSGVVLDVQATVSADRKYVTLTLRPKQANLLALQTFAFQTGSSVAEGGGVLNPVVTGQTGYIQEPELQITEVNCTVSVPDGGTLLLGGETIAGEVEKEVGTPILSKIPFLRRLFTNRSQAKDEQVLLILVKPTILIEREIENQQFPLLSSKLGS